MSRTTICKLGLWSAVAAFVALGLTVVVGNRNLGFGYTISRRHQLGLVAAAITVCVVQLVLYRATHGKENNAKRKQRP